MKKPLIVFSFLISTISFSFAQKENNTPPDDHSGTSYALFFAVENYEEWNTLQTPIDNAIDISDDLEELYGFKTEVVKNPTRTEIYDKLKEYGNIQYEERDQLLIAFSGHGAFIESLGEGFFIPKDGKNEDPFQDTYISHVRLRRIIDNIRCQHILLSIDACYSGTFDEQIASQHQGTNDISIGEGEQEERQRFIEENLRARTRLFITSGGNERTPDPSQFAEQFKAGLRAFGGQDQILEIQELYKKYLRKAHPLPRFGQFGSNETNSNFLFVLQEVKKYKTKDRPGGPTNIVPDHQAWQNATIINTIDAYDQYLQNFAAGEFVPIAEQKIRKLRLRQDEKATWEVALNQQTIEAFQDYMNKYPEGEYIALANTQLEKIIWSNTVEEGSWEAYLAYVVNWPNGPYIQVASGELIALTGFDSKKKKSRIRKKILLDQHNLNYEKLSKLTENLDQHDFDKDGVVNDLDQEPDTPPGAPVDRRGNTLDSDKDGVPDYLDKQPHRIVAPGWERVDGDGVVITPYQGLIDSLKYIKKLKAHLLEAGFENPAPTPDEPTPDETEWFLPYIHFAKNSHVIKYSDYSTLASLAKAIKNNYPFPYVVTGHLDMSTEELKNPTIAFYRAKSTIDHLVEKHGIERSRLILQYEGKEGTLVSGQSSYMNRRVEFRFAVPEDIEMDIPDGK